MKKQAEYIKRIEIKGLWGRKNIAWDLRPDVNILSGVNGIGKSTILNNSVRRLSDLEGGALSNGVHEGVSFTFYPEDATYIHFDVIRSFDRPLLSAGLLDKIGNQNVKTELDWQLYLLQRRYLDYQVNIGNRIISLLTSGKPENQAKAADISRPKTHFQDLMDDLFSETGKKILRQNNEILFEQDGDILTPSSCLPAKSRCWSSCSPYWCRTTNRVPFSWTNRKSPFTWNGSSASFLSSGA